MDEKLYWIWISRINCLGSIKVKELLKKYKTPENIWNLTKTQLMENKFIGEKTSEEILNIEYRKNLEQYLKYMEKYNVKILDINNKDYPEKLKNIYDSPQVIYIKGNEKILNDKSIAIVGARECTEYGKEVAKKISYELCNNNINIISGMAKGIDTYAHIGAICAKGKTIAVLGSGLDRIYPKENIKIYNKILENNGAIISEYVIGTPPGKMRFPARNRIISGISNGVLVIEAKKKSGSLITVDFALEQGKNVFAIPGDIVSKTSEGTNELLKQGAKCVTSINDILEEDI